MSHRRAFSRGIMPTGPNPARSDMSNEELLTLQEQLRRFAEERDWDQFHSPKNLAMALSVEASEIVEHFQWLTEQQSMELSPEQLAAVELELADAFIYMLRLADKLDLDLVAAAAKKMALNETRYPAEQVHGSAKKYTEYK